MRRGEVAAGQQGFRERAPAQIQALDRDGKRRPKHERAGRARSQHRVVRPRRIARVGTPDFGDGVFGFHQAGRGVRYQPRRGEPGAERGRRGRVERRSVRRMARFQHRALQPGDVGEIGQFPRRSEAGNEVRKVSP